MIIMTIFVYFVLPKKTVSKIAIFSDIMLYRKIELSRLGTVEMCFVSIQSQSQIENIEGRTDSVINLNISFVDC